MGGDEDESGNCPLLLIFHNIFRNHYYKFCNTSTSLENYTHEIRQGFNSINEPKVPEDLLLYCSLHSVYHCKSSNIQHHGLSLIDIEIRIVFADFIPSSSIDYGRHPRRFPPIIVTFSIDGRQL